MVKHDVACVSEVSAADATTSADRYIHTSDVIGLRTDT